MRVDVEFRLDGFKQVLSDHIDGLRGNAHQAVLQGCEVIKREAKERAPISPDGGTLRRSITSRVVVDGDEIVGVVGTNVEYARHVEFGHRTRLGKGKIKSKVGGIHFVPGRFYMKSAMDSKGQAALGTIISALKGEG